jgi:hypothetical protein
MPNVWDVDEFRRCLSIRCNRPNLVAYSDSPCVSWLPRAISGKRPEDCVYCFDRTDRSNTCRDVTYIVTAWRLGMSNTGDSVSMWNYFVYLNFLIFPLYLIKFGIHHRSNSFRHFRKIAKRGYVFFTSLRPHRTTCIPLDTFSLEQLASHWTHFH